MPLIAGCRGYPFTGVDMLNRYDFPMPGPWRQAHFYGHPADHGPLDWSWVESELLRSGTYWVVARNGGHPHPRPVWGTWHSDTLFLSIGSPFLLQAVAEDPLVTVHLESGSDVVIVEGNITGFSTDAEVIAAYDEKYDWSYDVAEYGPLVVASPAKVLAWQAAGWAGRESFRRSGSWLFVG